MGDDGGEITIIDRVGLVPNNQVFASNYLGLYSGIVTGANIERIVPQEKRRRGLKSKNRKNVEK